ncbi:MAG TPA: GNAT family N-acetyltransferase [Mycobacteriales bacterium]|nr:GNAT family N-acetyltransferase [Mycobacteriales bacterium]
MRSEPLTEAHDRRIDSGNADLDGWLRDHALGAEARRTSRTFVWTDGGRVVAYYAVSAHRVLRADLPRALGHGSPTEIPAVLLAKLALDRSWHGQGLGGVLLADALTRIVRATEVVAARFVVVDAIDDNAAAFYEHHGFRRVPGDGPARLVQKVSAIAASLG